MLSNIKTFLSKNLITNKPISSFFLLFLCYWFINFFLIPINPFISSPCHHEDYWALSVSSCDFPCMRPIVVYFSIIFTYLGPLFFYSAMHFLTVLYAYLVWRFIVLLFSLELNYIYIILFGVLVFSVPIIIEYGKSLGLISNLLSATLGMSAMISLLKGYRSNKNKDYILAAIFFTLSGFAKEDFILPPLLLSFYLLATPASKSPEQKQKNKLLYLVAFFLLFLPAIWIYNRYIVGSVITINSSNPSTPYKLVISINSILQLVIYYLLHVKYVSVITCVAIPSFLGLLIFLRKNNRIKLLLIVVIIFALIGPYSILPNHIFDYYSYIWLNWEAVIIVLGFYFIFALPVFSENIPRLKRYLVPIIVIILSITTIKLTQMYRVWPSGWYAKMSEINTNMIDTLQKNRDRLSKEKHVGIVGIEGLSPWSKTNGLYLKNKLHIDTKWILFVKENSIFITINADNKINPHENINVLHISEINKFPDMLILYFNQDGQGIIGKPP